MAEYKTEAQVNYGWGLTLEMTGKAPAVAKRIWRTLLDAQTYVNDPLDSATPGLTLSVIDDGNNNGLYFVRSVGTEYSAGVLEKIGSGGGDLSNYYTKAETQAYVSGRIVDNGAQTSHENAWTSYATRSEIDAKVVDSASAFNEHYKAPSGYVVQDALNAKQDTLTWDSSPTGGSSNPVTSGGVYNSLQSTVQQISRKVDRMEISQIVSAITTLSCMPNTYYNLASAVNTLTVSLPSATSSSMQNIILYFTTGADPLITFTSITVVPIYAKEGYAIEANKTYEVNILWNGSAWFVADMEINTTNIYTSNS